MCLVQILILGYELIKINCVEIFTVLMITEKFALYLFKEILIKCLLSTLIWQGGH